MRSGDGDSRTQHTAVSTIRALFMNNANVLSCRLCSGDFQWYLRKGSYILSDSSITCKMPKVNELANEVFVFFIAMKLTTRQLREIVCQHITQHTA